jgi:hypothetical protein
VKIGEAIPEKSERQVEKLHSMNNFKKIKNCDTGPHVPIQLIQSQLRLQINNHRLTNLNSTPKKRLKIRLKIRTATPVPNRFKMNARRHHN